MTFDNILNSFQMLQQTIEFAFKYSNNVRFALEQALVEFEQLKRVKDHSWGLQSTDT